MNAPPDNGGDPLEYALMELASRHGSEAVRDAARRLYARRSGRPPDPDLEKLGDVFREDARDILEGRTSRSNYAVAKAFANARPGHSREATQKRIERKLRKNRRWVALLMAANASAAARPYTVYLDVLRQLVALGGDKDGATAQALIADAELTLATYRSRIGEPPPHASMSQLANALRGSCPDQPARLLGSNKSLLSLGPK
jgi:hypothetical protein